MAVQKEPTMSNHGWILPLILVVVTIKIKIRVRRIYGQDP